MLDLREPKWFSAEVFWVQEGQVLWGALLQGGLGEA